MRKNKAIECMVLALLGGSLPLSSAGKDSTTEPSAALPELVVLARRRPEEASAIPLQVQTLSSTVLTALHLDQLSLLTTVVPGLQVSDSGTATRLSLRGIGSGSNPGFEQSVGFYVDGIHYGRQPLARLPLLDIEQIEVLHGPQGILLGKNSIAGAITVHSAAPASGRFTRGRLRLEPFSRLRESTLIHNTGTRLNHTGHGLRARVALRHSQSEGELMNPTRGRRTPQQAAYSGRLRLQWQLPQGSVWGLSAERHRLHADGRALHSGPDKPGTGGSLATQWQALGLPSLPALEHPGPLTNAPEPRQLQHTRLSLTFMQPLPSGTLEFHSALLTYLSDETCDCDYLPFSLFTTRQQEHYRQLSHEVRLSGESLGLAHWQTGLYAQSHWLRSDDVLHLPDDSLLPGLLSSHQSALPSAQLLGTSALRMNQQSGDVGAWYAQTDLALPSSLRLTLGVRYTREWRRAQRQVQIMTPGSSRFDRPLAPWFYEQVFAIHSVQASGHWRQGRQQESAWLPLLSLQWLGPHHQQLYISARRGHKAGGFDARANHPDSFAFMPERALAYELGVRQRFPDLGVQLSATLFRTRYDNLQMSQFDGVIGFNVTNAADTQIEGLSLSLRWQALPALRLETEWTWLEAHFRRFPTGNCYSGQLPDNGRHCTQDRRRLQWAPSQQGRIGLHTEWHRGHQHWETGVQLSHEGAQHLHDNLDPRVIQPTQTLWHVFASVHQDRWHWRFSLHNPFDRQTFSYASSVPLSHTLFGSHTYVRYRAQPRALNMSLQHDF